MFSEYGLLQNREEGDLNYPFLVRVVFGQIALEMETGQDFLAAQLFRVAGFPAYL